MAIYNPYGTYVPRQLDRSIDPTYRSGLPPLIYQPGPTHSTPLPPSMSTTPGHSVQLPPQQVQTPTHSVQYPPLSTPVAPSHSVQTPPQQVPGPTHSTQLPPQQGGYDSSGINPNGMYTGGNPPGQQASFAPGDVVNQTLEKFLNGPYAANARRRGMEVAASRGLINSGMAAGNSERAALESVQPFVQSAMGLLGQREDNAFKGEMQSNQAFQQDWLNNNQFNRSFYAQMASIPMNSAAQLQQMMAQYALENPDVYTPNNMAGMSEFFNNNLQQIMAQYFNGQGA